MILLHERNHHMINLFYLFIISNIIQSVFANMAANHPPVNNFAIFFILLLAMTIAVDMPKLQVMGSCGDDCSSNSECGGWTACQWCWEKTDFNGNSYRSCSILP
ncbi:fruit-specific protein-like [Solanum dulcamara]|uniref:fruit-specific protein-like n=1 Tax=Solanum dulcamara TaxID=45834 RepID=UPI0024867440|nr:fruit-specific protein-like [Solanum dulcamara]